MKFNFFLLCFLLLITSVNAFTNTEEAFIDDLSDKLNLSSSEQSILETLLDREDFSSEIETLQTDLDELDSDLIDFKDETKDDIQEVKQDLELQIENIDLSDIQELKTDFKGIQNDFFDLDDNVSDVKRSLSKITGETQDDSFNIDSIISSQLKLQQTKIIAEQLNTIFDEPSKVKEIIDTSSFANVSQLNQLKTEVNTLESKVNTFSNPDLSDYVKYPALILLSVLLIGAIGYIFYDYNKFKTSTKLSKTKSLSSDLDFNNDSDLIEKSIPKSSEVSKQEKEDPFK